MSLKLTDRSERNLAQGVSAYDQFFSLYTLITKDQNFRGLSLARNVKHGAVPAQPKQSDKAVPAQRLRMPAVTWAAIRDTFISPAHFTKPERWPLPEGPYTKGWLIAPCRIFYH